MRMMCPPTKKQLDSHLVMLRNIKEFEQWAKSRTRHGNAGTHRFPAPAQFPCLAGTIIASWGNEEEYPVYYVENHLEKLLWRFRMEQTNFKKIEHGVYLVRTQAGVKHALKDYFGGEPYEKDRVLGHPTSYPSVLFIAGDPSGRSSCLVTAIHVNKMLANIQGE